MPLIDWWKVGAAGIQGTFSWIWYTQNSMRADITWRQQQKYQKKNYNIAWIAIARRDVLNMMSVSVNRINNYLIIGTLILGVDAGIVWSVRFVYPHEDLYVILAFYANMGFAMMYLLLSIVIGVKGQNRAFHRTFKLLTDKVRPENPATYNHDYMVQMQWIERNGLRDLFRVPGIQPDWSRKNWKADFEGSHADVEDNDPFSQPTPGSSSASAQKPRLRKEDFTALENLDAKTSHTWYLSKYADFMQLWLWHEKFARMSMGLGVICLLQGSVYYMVHKMGMVLGGTWAAAFAALLIGFMFLFTLGVVLRINIKILSYSRLSTIWITSIMAAPAFGAISAWLDGAAEVVFALFCFITHTLFWVFALLIHCLDPKVMAERRFVLDEFWSKHSSTADPKTSAEHERERLRQARSSGPSTAGSPDVQISFDMGAKDSVEHWPTEDNAFDRNVRAARRKVRGVVTHMLLVSIAFWLIASIVVITVLATSSFEDESEPSASNGSSQLSLAVVESFPMAWKNDLEPLSLACRSSKVFLTDGRNIFELRDGELQLHACKLSLDSAILDMTVFCDANQVCTPVVLQRAADKTSRITDCRFGTPMKLLQEPEPMLRLDLLEDEASRNILDLRFLVAGRNSTLMQYRWSKVRGAWEPEWPLGSTGVVPLRALATDHSQLILFYSALDRQPALESRSLTTMQTTGSWSIGPYVAPIISGCVLAYGNEMLVLTSVQSLWKVRLN